MSCNGGGDGGGYANLVCEATETEGQAGKGLVSSTGLCDNGNLGGRTVHVPAGNLDALGIAMFVLEGSRGGSGETSAVRGLPLLADGPLCRPADG